MKTKTISIPDFVRFATVDNPECYPTVVRQPDGKGFKPTGVPSEADMKAILDWCATYSMVVHYEASTGGFSFSNV